MNFWLEILTNINEYLWNLAYRALTNIVDYKDKNVYEYDSCHLKNTGESWPSE